MKQLTLNFTILLGIFLFSGIANKSFAQVTIGSAAPPEKAALLELKTREVNPSSVTDTSNVTSKSGGLGLPRVFLENKETLEPFIPLGSDEWNNRATNKVREKHAGLMVYNINVPLDTEKDPNKIFVQGLYLWDGGKWNPANENSGKFFYMPSFKFTFDLAKVGQPDTLDLYARYANQFLESRNSLFVTSNSNLKSVPSPRNGRLYERKELDYVITYYDKGMMDVSEITDMGVMRFTIKRKETTADSFMNVVFVVK